MTDELQAQIAGAEAYEALHVRALFAQWAPRVLDAAEVGAGQAVVDVACGTGVLARAAVERVGAEGRVVGVDANAGMLVVAETLEPGVDWREGVAERLPADDGEFDRYVSQFGMMFFSDPAGALDEAVRVLVPGGRFAVAVWDALENAPAYAAELELLEEMAGPAAAEALRVPFAMGDIERLRELAASADAVDVDCTTVPGTARFPSVRAMVEADLRGWLPVMDVHLDEKLIVEILAAAEDVLAEFVGPDGRTNFTAPAHILTGAAPGG